MALMRHSAIIVFLAAFSISDACGAILESDFVSARTARRRELIAGYSMNEQWRIFKYANQEIHPPMIGLASVLARKGRPMLDLILEDLESASNDLDYRDALQVFQSMESSGSYHICANKKVLARIQGYRERIGSAGWQEAYEHMLIYLCRKNK